MRALLDGGCEDISTLAENWSSYLVTPALTAFLFVYLYALYRIMVKFGGEGLLGGDGTKNKKGGVVSSVRFSDVAGIDDAKRELEEVVQCLRNPARYQSIGAKPPRGVLLHGPSGTGKTLLARAVAGEENVGSFLSCSASDFVEMLVGRGAARIRDLFERARKEAREIYQAEQRRRRMYFRWRNSPNAVTGTGEPHGSVSVPSNFSANPFPYVKPIRE